MWNSASTPWSTGDSTHTFALSRLSARWSNRSGRRAPAPRAVRRFTVDCSCSSGRSSDISLRSDTEGLTGTIGAFVDSPEFGDHCRDIDDRAIAAFGHSRRQLGNQEVRHLDVESEYRVEIRFRHPLGPTVREDAGVVAQDVDPTEPFDRTPGECPRRRRIAQVRSDELRTPARGADRLDHLLATSLITAGHGHTRP
jgi:hypothetical protein